MTIEELAQQIKSVEVLSSTYYDKFETMDAVAGELLDVLNDWENDEDIVEPDVGDFSPNQIEDYHFECLSYREAQERIAGYPETASKILSQVKEGWDRV
jgi:broad specificity phosphatase PhoE